ncbi:heterokaryon incompatibility protein-domain-containing protein [Xylariaceae sp. FL0804]|nr:heterokaryon incompatibility protein-domain-containing protein [Xylariaceae sp. FL0804]
MTLHTLSSWSSSCWSLQCLHAMRLINCYSLELEEFVGGEIPKYAILSHTWQAGEVTYQIFHHRDERTMLAGWQKIEKTCELAIKHELNYAWVDTCCIDKSSSAELSEAINAMFQWYAGSEVCYAYLQDFDPRYPDFLPRSRWFQRGWTLQELIAPQQVKFFDKNWTLFGTRADMGDKLSSITRIDERILVGRAGGIVLLLSHLPACQKMCWAASRETKRDEDMAYCLLGIFDVNMPLLYGEGGKKAFRRLQEEIVRNTNDLTILAWVDSLHWSPDGRGVLAPGPRSFFSSGRIMPMQNHSYSPSLEVTNKGLRITTHFRHRSGSTSGSSWMSLECYDCGNQTTPALPSTTPALPLGLRLFLSRSLLCYRRYSLDRMPNLSEGHYNSFYETRYLETDEPKYAQPSQGALPHPSPAICVFRVVIRAPRGSNFDIQSFEPRSRRPASGATLGGPLDSFSLVFRTLDARSFTGFGQLRVQGRKSLEPFVVACGYDIWQDFWVCAGTEHSSPRLWEAALARDLEVVGAEGHSEKCREIRLMENNANATRHGGLVSVCGSMRNTYVPSSVSSQNPFKDDFLKSFEVDVSFCEDACEERIFTSYLPRIPS